MRGQTSTHEQAWQVTTGATDLDALGTWIWDVGRKSLTCSEEITDIAGLEPGELDGHVRSFLALMPRDRRRGFAEKMLRRARQGLPFTERFELRRPDGQACVVRLTGRPFRDTDGGPRWIVGTLSAVAADSDPGFTLATCVSDDASPQWVEPRDRRSAVEAYRRVYELVPHPDDPRIRSL